MPLVDSTKISGVEVVGLGFIETTVTTTKQMFTSGRSVHPAIGINNTTVLKKQNGMDFLIEDLELSREFCATNREGLRIVSPFRDDSVQKDAIERKRRARYNRTVR